MVQQTKGQAAKTSEQADGQLDTVMHEARVFAPPAQFVAQAQIKSLADYEKLWNEAAADIEKFWGQLAGELHWFEPFTKVLDWNEPFAHWFVGGKTNASYNCLDAHLELGHAQQGRHHLGRRAGRAAHAHLSRTAPRSLQIRQRLEKVGPQSRRRRLDLHADDARAGHCHAGLCPHRRGALGHLRRLFQRSDCRPQQRRQGQAGHHGRCRLASRPAVAAQSQRRCRAGQIARPSSTASCSAVSATPFTCRQAATIGGTI